MATENEFSDGVVTYRGPLVRDVLALVGLDESRVGPLHGGERLFRRHPDRGFPRLRRDPRHGGERREAVAGARRGRSGSCTRSPTTPRCGSDLHAPADLAGGPDRGAVTFGRPIPRYLGVVVLLAMAGFAAVGFFAIRKDVENLRVISQDNTQWSASQMEIELLRFRLSLAALLHTPTPEAVDDMHERFDILWSRVFMMGHGRPRREPAALRRRERVGRGHRRLSQGDRPARWPTIDPVADAARIGDDRGAPGRLPAGAARVHAPGDARRRRRGREVRERIQSSARNTAVISVARGAGSACSRSS